MNPPSLLQIVERLERLAGRLPGRIRKAVLSELTPLKQLFLQQRPPRFLITGSGVMPIGRIISALFAAPDLIEVSEIAVPSCRWHDINLPDRGTISILDARRADVSTAIKLEDELKYQPADIIFFIDEGQIAGGRGNNEPDNFTTLAVWNKTSRSDAGARVIGIVVAPSEGGIAPGQINQTVSESKTELRSNFAGGETVSDVFKLVPEHRGEGLELPGPQAQRLMSILARQLPNQARMEMIRISRDRAAQHEVAQLLVKSTTAICAAVGAQPIPLADLPILTSLQVMMISGIMYVSGRERSLRAATEFIGALGANVGAAMLLREGTRAVLKFFPGWGNVICGLVAGSATYAIGRAATVFFIDGVSLKDARRTYRTSRKKRARLALSASGSLDKSGPS